MAVKTSVKTGKATEAATWSNAKAVEAGDDIVLANGFNVTWDTLEKPRSLIAESGATMTSVAGKPLKLGASTVREVKAGEVVHLKISSGATWSFTESIDIASTSATTAGIWMGGKSLSSASLTLKESGKYKLEEAVTGPAGSGVMTAGTCTLETNGQEVAVGNMKVKTGTTCKLGVSLVKLSATSGEIWVCSSTATLAALESTIELTGTAALAIEFEGGGKAYGTVAMPSFSKMTGANTFSTFRANSKGAAAGKGIQLPKTVKQIVTTLTTNGTEAEPALLESTEAGKPAELEITEQETTGFLHLKDVTVLKGVWYLPSGKDEGGNKIVKPTASFTVAFEAKPGGAISLSGSATMKMAGSVAVKAAAVVTGSAAMIDRAAATAKAAAVPSGSSGMRMAAAGTVKAAASPAGSAAMRMAAAGTVRAAVSVAGSARSVASCTVTVKAAAAPVGKAAMRMASTATLVAGPGGITLTGVAHMRMAATATVGAAARPAGSAAFRVQASATLTVAGGPFSAGAVRPGRASGPVTGRPAGPGEGAVEGRERISQGRTGGPHVRVAGPRSGVPS